MTNGPIIRGALVALAVVSLPASRADAFCHLFKSWFGGAPTTTYYAPYTASYAPAGCGQTVNYVAQTSYRTVYVNAPVTTLRPMPAVDGCTGCPTTVMRPVVTYVPQARLVPYTSFRPVVTAAAACCGAVTTAAYLAPAAPVYAAAPVAAPAPCCGGGAPAMAAPALGRSRLGCAQPGPDVELSEHGAAHDRAAAGCDRVSRNHSLRGSLERGASVRHPAGRRSATERHRRGTEQT